MIHAIRNFYVLQLMLKALLVHPFFTYIVNLIVHPIVKLFNTIFPIKKAIDVTTNKNVILRTYFNYWFGIKLFSQKYTRLFIHYNSPVRHYKTIICCNLYDIKQILSKISKHHHTYPKIILDNVVILESISIGTIDILSMMKNFIRYNVDITLGDIFKINNIDHIDKSMKITYYKNFDVHEVIINDITVHLSKNICNSILMIMDNLEPKKDNSETIILDNIYNDLEPKKGGLMDRFGPKAIPNYSECMTCTTCGLNMIYCPLHFGCIDE